MTLTLDTILLLIALLCFGIATFGWGRTDRINLVAAGLALLTLVQLTP